MMFRDYIRENKNKAYNNTLIKTKSNKQEVNPKIWTSKTINGELFLMFNEKMLNINKLKKEIDKVYTENGYTNYGYSKLSINNLIEYTTIKSIFMEEFEDSLNPVDLDPTEIAQKIFDNEYKEFEWLTEPSK